jgi:hypothetical protein
MSNSIEDRLRDAYQAKTAQLTEQRLDQFAAAREHGLDDLHGVEHTVELPALDFESARARKRPHRWIAPTLAAAAVATLAIGVTTVTGIAHESKPKPVPPASHVSSPPPSSSAPSPSASASQQTVAAPPYLPAGRTGSRDQVPWSAVGSGWRLLQPTNSAGDRSEKLYLYDPADGRYLITDALPAGASLLAWSPDGQRAMLTVESQHGTVTSYYELSLRFGPPALILKRNSSHFVTYTRPTGRSFLIQENPTPYVAKLSRYSTQGVRALTYPTVAGGNRIGSGSAIYTPDGGELILQSADGVSVLLGNDGHYIRTFGPPAGYDRCNPLKLWTSATLLESCRRTAAGQPFALFVQPLGGGTPTVLADGAGTQALGYGNAWQLSNGDVLLQALGNCGGGGYQILHEGSGAITPLRGPRGVPSPHFITSMDGDVATFVVGDGGCAAGHPGGPTLVDYNVVTGQTRTLLDQPAIMLSWPGDAS